MSILTKSSILITGGTGSFGKAFIDYALNNLDPKRIVVFSRDELKQYEARQKFNDDPRLRWFIGDIRDQHRLIRAMHNIDYVIHAAALKQVDTAEYNPFEYVQTNIIGTQNVIEAAIDAGVKKVVALSTDKASSPINLYGASVVPFWRELSDSGREIPITDSRMTRFWITLPQAVKFVIESFELMQGGEVFVPRIPSMKIMDLAEAVAPGAITQEIGIRPGEKLHEEMIAADDSRRTISLVDRYVILPTVADWGYEPLSGDPVADGFAYRSDSNDIWISVDEIRKLLQD